MNRRILTLALALAPVACGGDQSPPAASTASAGAAQAASAPAASGSELTPVELEQGLGPIRDLTLAEVDPALAETGKDLFTTKCSACHKIGERYVGPDLSAVLSRRRAEFVMNQMLNANEMVQRHPVIKELLAQYYTPMPVQVTDTQDARAILEYLRSVQTDPTSDSAGAAGGN